jgi:hypothetical protein
MKPYIINVDRTNPLGEIVGNYGDYQWNQGFIMGHLSGLCVGGIIFWFILSR